MSNHEFEEIHKRINSFKIEEDESLKQLIVDKLNIINLYPNIPEYFVIHLQGLRSPLNFQFQDLNTNSLCLYLSKLKKPDSNQNLNSILFVEPFHLYSADLGTKKYHLFQFQKIFLSIVNKKKVSISFKLSSGFMNPNKLKKVGKPSDITTTFKKILKLSNNPDYDDSEIFGMTQVEVQTSLHRKKSRQIKHFLRDEIVKSNLDCKKSYFEFMKRRAQLFINDEFRRVNAKHKRQNSLVYNLAKKTLLMKKWDLVRKEVSLIRGSMD